MNGLTFAHPGWLLALLSLWLLLTPWARTLRWPNLVAPLNMRYPLLAHLLAASAERVKSPASQLNRPLLMITAALLLIALAQPQKPGPALPQTQRPQAVDLILLVNTSVSMVLKDCAIDGFQVDRMAKQIDVLKRLVHRFRGARIALVVLGRPAAVWLPLTRDRALVASALQHLQTTLGGRNSDIGATLELVAQAFPAGTNNRNQQRILLVSDGYQQLGAETPQQASRKLAQMGYRIDTLAIGSTRFAESKLGKAHLIYQPVDLALMQQLADIGHGRMLRARAQGIIDKLLQALDNPTQRTQSQQPRPQIALYPWPLSFAMLLLLWQWLDGRRLLQGLRA